MWLIRRHNFNEFIKPASTKGISVEDIHLSSDDLEMYIDLAPFLNPSPYVVPEDMSVTKVSAFLPRVDSCNAYVGMLLLVALPGSCCILVLL